MSDEANVAVALPALPTGTGLAGLYPTTHLADAFRIRLPRDAVADPETLARFVFAHLAPWVTPLMRVRDAVMGRLGVKTSRQLRDAGGEQISAFRIYTRSADEIVLGADDSHLDFRVSVLRTVDATPKGVDAGLDAGLDADLDADGVASLTLSTVVHCHNRLGRAYLLAIAPIHRRVVRSGLDRAARLGWPKIAAPPP